MKLSREYDIAVYGASSFTAKFVIEQLMETDYKVILAARNKNKIHKSCFDTFSCSSENISELTSKASVLINLAGPYIESGIDIIEACIKTQTHYVDITGEVNFIKKAKEFHQEARRNNVTCIQSCGFDSIPSDLGAFYLAKHFETCEIKSEIVDGNVILNTGTWLSLLSSLRSFKNKDVTRKKEPLISYHKDYAAIKWFGPDAFVVRQSAEELKNLFKYTFTMSMRVKSKLYLYLVMFYMFLITKLVHYNLFYALFRRFPRIFSFGLFRNKPDEKQLKKGFFKIEMTAVGQIMNKTKTKKLLIEGGDPGYESTSIFVTQCAFQLLKNKNKIASGVQTPAAALYKTNIIECIKEKGIKFI